jgi:ABC-type nitrate/sulfonate/bicarbonate transport system substrate-binding protein
LLSLPTSIQAQSTLKKVRLALPTKTISFLAFYIAHRKGFYKDAALESGVVDAVSWRARTTLSRSGRVFAS